MKFKNNFILWLMIGIVLIGTVTVFDIINRGYNFVIFDVVLLVTSVLVLMIQGGK